VPNERSPEHVAFGQAVRKFRLEQGLSQEELGYAADLHRNYIGGVERGELNASLASINKLANGLRVKPSQLLAAAEYQQAAERRRSRTRR
jgi:transcriptional regulator with XRE-family HTH domain